MENKTTLITKVLGAITGIAGMEHGIGEILQGNGPAEGLVFASWPDSKMFANMAGEPAMSLIPNMLVSGIFSIVISLIFIYWALRKSKQQNYGIGFLVLSIFLLLVGGGFGPPLLGIILGGVTLASRRNKKTGNRNNAFILKQFGKSWKKLFGITLTLWLFLFPVFPLLSFYFHIQNGDIVGIVAPSAFLFLALSYFSANLWDRFNSDHVGV